MNLRALAIAGLASLTFAAATVPVQAQTATTETVMSTEELMRATALDEIFIQFGPTIETSPMEQGLPMTSDMSVAWTAAAREVFTAASMQGDLARALDDRFTADDYETFAAFFHSDFGVRMTEIERAVTKMSPEAQLAAREDGIALSNAASGTTRATQIDEMLELVSAEIAMAMVRQSVRGMLVGMSINAQQGDIQIPWDEIDVHLDAIMPGIESGVAETQRAMMFYAYQDLTDADVEQYLMFLRTASARKFYALAAYSIGDVIATHMEAFGEALTRRLDRVGV